MSNYQIHLSLPDSISGNLEREEKVNFKMVFELRAVHLDTVL
jgi:hypothetical protein